MGSVALVTDSTAYLPAELVQKYNITVIPLYVRFGEEVFRDNVDMNTEQFYSRLQTAPVMPATSQPSAGDFIEVYRHLVQQGATEIISAHISSKLSGTVSSAILAQDQITDVPIHIVDSLSTSMGLGFLVLKAARDLEAGRAPQEIIKTLEELREQILLYFVVDTLEFLHRGGRIGGAQAFLGSMLNLKPLLALKDGHIEAVERVRTKRKAVQRMLDLVGDEVGDRPVSMAMLHAAAPDEVGALREQAEARLNSCECYETALSPTIGTHTGPGTLGVVTCPCVK